MPKRSISGRNVLDCRPLPTPAELLAELPRTRSQSKLVTRSRRAISSILTGADPRLLVVVGPCSIHDFEAGMDYGRRLAALTRDLGDRLMIVMRTYFEKPRTSVGWQGLILDPDLNGKGDIAKGLRLARCFLRETLDLGLPTATEFLDPISPQFIADLVCWAAIGARTSESQMHRQLASGLSMPLGFKNGTDGSVQNAVNAIKAAGQVQSFLGISADGRAAAVRTRGNSDCHIVLRGGASGPNYSAAHLSEVESRLDAAGLRRAIMVDCNHDNSGRRPEQQPEILDDVVAQILSGNRSIVGIMVESNLFSGCQPLTRASRRMRYGVSITDGCLDWLATERCLREAHAALAPRFDSANAWDPTAISLSAAGA
jgi:3-deoxy-7-phosphoheptulonate synthase